MNTIKCVLEETCTGCGTCQNICPVDAINMEINKEGFQFPKIDVLKCISCGKCKSACPALYPKYENTSEPEIYAAIAEDRLRMDSSSGAMFPVLAEYIIKKGGVVCGAAFTEDFRNVEHIIISNQEELVKLKGSKYIQSEIGLVYREIKKILDLGKIVLFTGCPCQVAGLKNFLNRDYSNLLVVDILCHGVPSPKSYHKYLDTIVLADRPGGELKSFSFRDKYQFGWAPSAHAVLKDGYYYSKAKNETMWYNAFLNILNCRKSCGQCQFNRMPRQGDITLGDFWGEEGLNSELRDGKGISLVCLNNNKGIGYFNEVKSSLLKYEKTTLEIAKNKNWNLIGSSKSHKNRYRFFDLLDKYDDFDRIVDYSLNRKFDIGFVGWWYGENYGSAITDYALWKVLTDWDYSVLMLEWPEKVKPEHPVADTAPRRFAKKYYEISMRRTYDELPALNNYCDMFIVASDQLWNYWSTSENGGFFFLDFVEDSKKKIAYATSFGNKTYWAPRERKTENIFHMSRFDAISVREDTGVDVCKDIFGVESVCNADPVFLVEKEHWNRIAEDSKLNIEEDYILAYILTPSREKRETILSIAQKENLHIKLILDAQEKEKRGREVMNMEDSVVEDLEIEDWLYLIKHSKYVLTDSFHGTCFSFIFEKQFVTFANIQRGIDRFNTFFAKTGLNDRMVYQPEEALKVYKQQIDFNSAKRRMKPFIEKSKVWLYQQLKKKKPEKASAYDLLIRRLRKSK